MSEQALPIAVRADESAKAAHKRLDNINGSIDRLNTKVEGAERRLGDKVDDIDHKLDTVLVALARRDGAEGAQSKLLDSKRFWIGIIATILTSALAALILTLLLRRHT